MSHCHLGPTFQNSTTLSQTTVQLFGPSCFHPWSQFLLTSLLKMPLLPSHCFNLFWPQWPDVLLNLAITAFPANSWGISHLPIANRPNLVPLKGSTPPTHSTQGGLRVGRPNVHLFGDPHRHRRHGSESRGLLRGLRRGHRKCGWALGRRPSKTQKWIELWRNAGDVLGLWFFKSFVFFWMVLGFVVTRIFLHRRYMMYRMELGTHLEDQVRFQIRIYR